MNRVTAIVRMYARDRFGWLYLPWIILASTFVVNLFFAFVVDEEIKTGGLASFYVYMLVAGIVSMAQTFPFTIGFTVRRKDYMFGTLATVTGLNAAFALLLLLLTKIEADWFAGWGVDLIYFSLPYLTDDGVLGQWWTHFGLMLHAFMLGFLIGSVYRRVGRNGLYFVIIAVFLVFMIAAFIISQYGYWDEIWHWLQDHVSTAAALSTHLLPITVIYALISYVLIRKAAV